MDFESRDLSFLAGNPSSRFDGLFMRASIKAIARLARERDWSAEELRDYVDDHSGYRHYGFPDEASFDEFVSTMCNEFEIEPGQDGLPREFYEHAGALVDFAYYTVRTSPRPQPVLALLGGICLASCLIGRKIKSSLGAKGNIFVATFAKSAAGKNRVLEAFNEVATAAGCPEYILPGDMTSDSALADALSRQPAGLWPLDEFGKFLRVANDEKASGPLVLLISLIMRLFTSCGLSNFVPKKFADSDKDRVIDMPHLVIYATGTPESLRFLTAENNRDGFNSRFVFYGDDSSRPLHQSVEEVPIPEPLLNWMKVAANYRPHDGDVTWEPGEMRTIPVTPEAKLAWERFRRRCDVLAATYTEDEGASIYARAAERASSLALIFAASQVPIDRDFSIEKAHMDWAIALTDWLTVANMKCASKVGENERERDKAAIVAFITEKGRGGATQSQVTIRFQRMGARYRYELVTELEATDIIRKVETMSGKSRTATFYAAAFAPAEPVAVGELAAAAS